MLFKMTKILYVSIWLRSQLYSCQNHKRVKFCLYHTFSFVFDVFGQLANMGYIKFTQNYPLWILKTCVRRCLTPWKTNQVIWITQFRENGENMIKILMIFYILKFCHTQTVRLLHVFSLLLTPVQSTQRQQLVTS